MRDQELRRVARQLALPGYGMAQQEALAHAHVLVIGAGGLGCPAMQSLASAGVGHITVIDDDTVDITNIHRQILFGASDVGRLKVEVAGERLAELQPGIEVTALNERLTTSNAVSLVGSADLVLDGSDSFQTKYLVADAAEITGTPLVWGTVLRFHGDVCLFTSGPSERGVGLRDLFPEQPPGIEDCATAGVLGATTAVVGALMATTAIGCVAGLDVVPGRMLSYDAFPGSTRTFQITADPARVLVTSLEPSYGEAVCAVGPSPLDEVRAGRAILLDIREPHEKMLNDSFADLNPVRLPLSDIFGPDTIRRALGNASRVVVHCASGVRSARFCEQYADLGYEFIDLPGGING
ncbi:MAG: ThiF family adenylyltransferase [Corynebacterium sp.]|uniref:ThiF family adenylyltransferase n=1 Tax=Corynebacterium sp. TaxID=1720 RepID=UPI0026E0DD07|nr:ThiF family adenylyltransferase [Corynebacterium sp.]MDO5670727.1 ThiF family adenylyltransferase [Corynebacterium sp.]